MLMSSPYDKYVQIYMVGLNRFGYMYYVYNIDTSNLYNKMAYVYVKRGV